MFIDTTLREGEQLYGVYFDLNTKKRIVAGLAKAGVEEVEVGCAGQKDVAELAAWAVGSFPGLRVSVWSPLRAEQLSWASSLPGVGVNVGMPSSDNHRQKRLGLDRDELLARMRSLLGPLAQAGVRLTLGLEDAPGADPAFLALAARQAQAAGVSRLRLSDTRGVLDPARTIELVTGLARETDLELAVHCHNDFGMATANAATALGCGALWADVSLLGLGERAGIAALEEAAAYFEAREPGRYGLAAIRGLCLEVAEAADIRVARTKAVVGADIFKCETGVHIHGLARDPALFEPYAPEAVGMRREVAVGKKSGRAAVALALSRLGAALDPDSLARATARVREMSASLGRPLTPSELQHAAAPGVTHAS